MVRGHSAVDLDALRRVVQRIDPDLAAHGATTMQALQAERVAQDRLGAMVSALFALFGLVLAGFSLFGLLSYSVEMRSPELGTRIALGATRARILRLILGQAGMRLVAGVAIGLALAAGLNQLLRGLVAGVEWVPVPALLGLTATLAAIALAASIVPALRATRLDPVRCLKG
jgi:ABC-type antimicrobial peptide transport system permease subunit